MQARGPGQHEGAQQGRADHGQHERARAPSHRRQLGRGGHIGHPGRDRCGQQAPGHPHGTRHRQPGREVCQPGHDHGANGQAPQPGGWRMRPQGQAFGEVKPQVRIVCVGHGRAQQARGPGRQALAPVRLAAPSQVGQTRRVAQKVVAVITHQGVAIEDQGGDAAQGQRDQGRIAQPARLHRRPDHHGHRRRAELDHDAGGRDGGSGPAIRQAQRRRRVHVRQGHQQQEGQAHLVRGTAPSAQRQRVAELVQGLEQRVDQPHHQQHARLRQAAARMRHQLRPVLPGHPRPCGQQSHPHPQ